MHKPPESSPGRFVSDLQEDFAQSKEIHFERFTLGYLSDKPCSDYCRSGLILLLLELCRNRTKALAGVAQWTEHQPVNRKVASSIPSQGTCLGFGPGPQ